MNDEVGQLIVAEVDIDRAVNAAAKARSYEIDRDRVPAGVGVTIW